MRLLTENEKNIVRKSINRLKNLEEQDIHLLENIDLTDISININGNFTIVTLITGKYIYVGCSKRNPTCDENISERGKEIALFRAARNIIE